MSKYRAERVTVDGIRFDSKDEARYYQDLKKRKAAGEIINFELQPKYELQPKFEKDGKKHLPINYIADFLIYHNDGSLEVVDVKGMPTPLAIRNRKEFEYHYPNLKLSWVARSLKYSETGWIDVDELKRIRSKNSKKGVS